MAAPSTVDGISTIDETAIAQKLRSHGLLDKARHWAVQPLSGGANNRVFTIGTGDGPPSLTVRLRRQDARSAAEIAGLSDAAGCPGVPRLRLLTDDLLILDYMPGRPRDLHELNDRQLRALGQRLACVHRTSHPAYTPWPELERRAGTRADLLRFRIASLKGYDSYEDALAGRVHRELPDLLARLANELPVSSSWLESTFSRLHGDLSRGNILWQNGEPGLIDWEYSRAGDPAEDLAYLLTEQSAGPEIVSPLREAYREAGGNDRCWERVPAYALFTSVDSALWWADYAGARGQDHGSRIDERVSAAMRWIV